VEVQGSGPPRNFGCGSLLWLGPHKIFTKRNLISANRHQERLCKPIKCSKSVGHRGFVPDPTGIAYCSAPQTPYLVGRETLPPQELHPLGHSSFAVQPCGPRHFRGPPQCCRRIGAYAYVPGLLCLEASRREWNSGISHRCQRHSRCHTPSSRRCGSGTDR